MSMYILVRGAWVGSWCWKRVRQALQAQGHEAFTPKLTGLADRSHLLSPQVNLETHITDIVNLMQGEELSQVVLCGHSYGGCMISGIADSVPERIDSLVYLDAFVSENGQSLHDIVRPEVRIARVKGAQERGDSWKVFPIPSEAFNVNPGDRGWMQAAFYLLVLFVVAGASKGYLNCGRWYSC
jgi:pimeloyl-ACP methyl ester carboxylesterase